ncbi:MAG: 23S rRNA (pseudouridine(1915)-N(3))-methyltransferase RlmH [Bacteroidetes bacterium]|nr:23S rRNA (pseudouridine(1915)-N(3))-methyltransferase RlmH [Bacteroidota bacterium]
MKIIFLTVGKTDTDYLKKGISIYEGRLKHYIQLEIRTIPDIKNAKNLTFQQQKEKEGDLILKQINTSDYLVLLDENSKEYSSVEFSKFIQKKMLSGIKNLFFVVGGPYGFSTEVYARANSKIALSKMTFSHQMVRLIFIEQLYRAFTILKNEPYHHV